MAIKITKVVTTVVDVGQGQCTFAVLYDGTKIVHTLLFDCGSDKESTDTPRNINSIAATLRSMDTPKIDLLVLSHSDRDHTDLLATLFLYYNNINPPAPKLQILSTWYGGADKFYASPIFKELKKYCVNFTRPDFNGSQYDRSTNTWNAPMWQSDDLVVEVRMLTGNVINDNPGDIGKKADDKHFPKDKNVVSIVCALMHDDRSLIICGDATNRTMAWINYYFKTATNPFPEALMLTLPHHGSRRTGLGNVPAGQKAADKAIKVLEAFAATTSPRTITVSATKFTHHHPSVELMNYFEPHILIAPVIEDKRVAGGTASHFGVWHVDLKLTQPDTHDLPQGYHTLISNTNVFATYYYGATPTYSYQFKTTNPNLGYLPQPLQTVNPDACWVYTTDSTGNSLVGITDMQTETVFTAPVNALAAPAGTEPTDAFSEEDRPQPPPPLLFPQPPKARPAGWVTRAPASAARALAASSLGRLRTFR